MILSDDFIRYLNMIIKKYISCFEGKRVVIFGCNPYCKTIKDVLMNNGVVPAAIVDNNVNKQGKICVGLKVYDPETYLRPVNTNTVIIIFSSYHHEMSKQLKTMGYVYEKNIIDFYDEKYLKEKSSYIQLYPNSELNDIFKSVSVGYGIYKDLQEKYNENTYFAVRFTPATGDLYLSCMYIDNYLKNLNISDYVLVVVNENCRCVAELFGISKVEVISQYNAESLVKASRILGTKMKVKPLSFILYGKKWLRYEKYPYITFMDMYKYDVFATYSDSVSNLSSFREIKAASPVFNRESVYAEKLFKEKGLIPGKTFILSPYTGSFPSNIPMQLWVKIAEHLKAIGYCVCTNCDGIKENPIVDTTPIFFPYNESVNVLELAGGFIAARSGLCDIVSTAACKMIILYEEGFTLSLGYDFFSLKKMGLKDEVNEFIWQDNIDKIFDEIMHAATVNIAADSNNEVETGV